jgi:dolichyl-diphosphooligosaccharide--protein glycosyltransferase
VYRVFAPALLLTGSLVVVGIGELAARREIAASTVLGLEAVGSIGVGGIAWITVPDIRQAGEQGVAYFLRTGQTEITETRSLLSPEYGVITTPIFYLGLTFSLSVAALVWVGWRVKREHQPTWLALTTYTGSFFMLALVQLRFAGQFGILAAVFAGLGFVYLVAAVDVTEYPRLFETDLEPPESPMGARVSPLTTLSLPDRQAAAAIVVLFLLVGSLGAVQTTNGNGLVVEKTAYDAAMAIDTHSTTADRTWPDNYVFSDWGRNRAYNYYVSGQSRSYWYAQQHYDEFLTSKNANTWYDQLSAKPTGYVVVTDVDGEPPQASMQSRLWDNWGSHSDDIEGVGHYRAVYANDERKVFELVSGAMLVGRGEPDESQAVNTEFEVGGETHTYERRVTTTANGWYAVRVPYNGSYDTGESTERVRESAVRNGTFTGTSDSQGHWPLNASRGNVAFDVTGGNHGQVEGAKWTNSGLSFDGDDKVRVPSGEELSPEGDFTLTVTFRTDSRTDYVDDVSFPRIAGTAPSSRFINSSGYVIALRRGHVLAALGDGKNGSFVQGPRVDDGEWHTVQLFREGATVRLVLDGQVVRTTQYSGIVTSQDTFAIGSTASGSRGYVGNVRNVTVSNTTI